MDIEYGPTTGTPENESFEVGQESKEDNESPQTGSGVESTVSAIKDVLTSIDAQILDWISSQPDEQKRHKETEPAKQALLEQHSFSWLPQSEEFFSSQEAKEALHTTVLAEELVDDVVIKLKVIDDLTETIKDPLAKKYSVDLLETARKMTAGIFEKVSERLGSNEGGWFLDKESGEKMYVKYYKNPDQARIEFIANAIYEKLGISSVRSQLFEQDGKLAIASMEVPNSTIASRSALKASGDVQNGFVADAYLANWDVVGLVYDNIVQGGDSQMYRVDNGGSIVFRAMGGDKVFPSDRVEELDSMRLPHRSSGEVFGDITETEMKTQAQKLVETLSDDVINAILSESNVTGDLKRSVHEGLVGRREYLVRRFELQVKQETDSQIEEPVAPEFAQLEGDQRLIKSIENLESIESEGALYPRIGMLADGDSIRDQQIDIINTPEGTNLMFKLRAGKEAPLLKKIEELYQNKQLDQEFEDFNISLGKIEYESGEATFPLAAGYSFKQDGIEVQISTGRPSWNRETTPEGMPVEVRSAVGLVRVILDESTPPNELGEKVEIMLEKILSIENILEAPEQEAELELKESQYKWHHKTETVPDDIATRLQRKEVFPGHFAMVEKDKNETYSEAGEFAVFHRLNKGGHESILRLLKSGGLIATHERFSRGVFREGQSSVKDLHTGGGDSVFTRTITMEGAKVNDSFPIVNKEDYVLVMENSVLDRTDWYAYDRDRYGSTSETDFTERQNPEELFLEQAKSGWLPNNEQMFNRGIAMDHIKHLATFDEVARERTIKGLRENGVEQINGKPVEEFVVVAYRMWNLIELANDRESTPIFTEQSTFGEYEIEVKYDFQKMTHHISVSKGLLSGEYYEGYVKDEADASKLFKKIETFMEFIDEEFSKEDKKKIIKKYCNEIFQTKV